MTTPIPQAETGPQTTILVVDDDLPFCHAAAELLADRGFDVLGCVGTARDAVAECRRLNPDAVLLDVQLPDGHGVTLAHTLRSDSGRPTIVLTSSDSDAVVPEQLQDSGANGFIPKSELAGTDLHVLFS